MRPIQILLLVLLVAAAIFFERRLRNQLFLKLLFLALMGGAILFTIVPTWSTVIANFLGVGRGVDLIIYLSLLGLTICCLLLYLKIQELQKQLTELARKQALEQD